MKQLFRNFLNCILSINYIYIHIYVFSLLSHRKKAQNNWSKDLVHDEPFGYQIVHHGYNLTSCPGILFVKLSEVTNGNKLLSYKILKH